MKKVELVVAIVKIATGLLIETVVAIRKAKIFRKRERKFPNEDVKS